MRDTMTGYAYLLKASMKVGSMAMDSRELVSNDLTSEQIAEIRDDSRYWKAPS